MTKKEKDEPEYNKGFVDGYRVGMNTAFDFVKKYCIDYQDDLLCGRMRDEYNKGHARMRRF